MSDPPQAQKNGFGWKERISGLRGFSIQLLLVTILPLTVLLLAVAFGSQMLHHDAMRSLVGDRDLKTVRSASRSLERELSHISSTLQVAARGLEENPDFSALLIRPEEISAIFDGGVALFSMDGQVIQSSSGLIEWQSIPSQFPTAFQMEYQADNPPIFSPGLPLGNESHTYILVSTFSGQGKVLIGAFSADKLIEGTVADLISAGQTTVLVISPAKLPGTYDVLYRAGPFKHGESAPTHPGIKEALNGESGINYFQSGEGEHIVAYNSITSTGWGLVIVEAWEDIASPYLMTTQAAPLVIVPVFLLALLAIWFGARRIITPLQQLEKLSASLAKGDFEAIQQPVGGIGEIRNLQTQLIEMAGKLNAAQQSLRSYIGAITAGVENERRSLARELHDDTVQSLIALNQRIQLTMMNAPEAQKSTLSELQSLVQQAMGNLRRMIRGLRPIYLEDLGLAASLEMLAQEMSQSANIKMSCTVVGPERRLEPQVEMSLYRMVQESLNNVVHHSQASRAWVEMEYTDTGLTVQVRDNGTGFAVPADPAEFPKKGHFGLLGLKERSEVIDASLEILSSPGEGTTILIELTNAAG